MQKSASTSGPFMETITSCINMLSQIHAYSTMMEVAGGISGCQQQERQPSSLASLNTPTN